MSRTRSLLMRWLYTALLYLVMPVVLLNLLRRGLRQRAYLQRWGERLGNGPRPAPGGVWVHCVSVGEFQAAIPLIRALVAKHPPQSITVSCTTPTASARIKAVFGQDVVHSYLPFDTPIAVTRFIRRVQPAVGVIVECELWPNLYAAAYRHGVRLVLANARVSARSAARFQRVPSLSKVMLARVSYVLAQGPDDAQRFLAMGARDDRVQVAGNLKFDITPPTTVDADAAAMRSTLAWPADAPVLVAGSVHAGEWQQVLGAFAQLREAFANARLVLVPRHPERFDRCTREATEFGQRRGWSVGRRSGEARGCDVLIGDSMGELLAYYRLGAVAFVGGTLVPDIGGHNTLEPAALGLPVLFGPHRATFADAGDGLIAAGAGWEVTDTTTLAQRTGALWRDAAFAAASGAKGEAFIAASRGAMDRALAAVKACEQRQAQGLPLGDLALD